MFILLVLVNWETFSSGRSFKVEEIEEIAILISSESKTVFK